MWLEIGVPTDCKGAVDMMYSRRGETTPVSAGLTCSGDPMMNKSKGRKRSPKKLSVTINGQPRSVPNKPRKGPLRRVKFNQSHSQGVNLADPASNMMRPLRMRTIRGRSSTRCIGTDYLCAITIGGTAAAAGDVLYTTVVNPSTLGLGRLATIAKLFERYKFKSLKFRYAPVANAQVTGQILGYVDYDTMDDPTGTSGVQNLQRAGAHLGEKPVQVWQGSEKPVFWEIKDVDPMTDLYCDSDGTDPRWTNQGRFVLLAASAIASGTACGNIYLDYDVEFYIPQMESTPTFGYGMKQTGSGTLSAASIFGSVRGLESWNNIPGITCTATTMSLPAGTYQVWGYLSGTVLAAFSNSSTGTVVAGSSFPSADAKAGSFNVQLSSPVPFTYTPGLTATTITSSIWTVTMLPSNAVTLSEKKLERASRLMKQIEALRLFATEERDEKVRFVTSSSASTCTSCVAGASRSVSLADISSGRIRVDDDYCIVKKN